MKAPFTLNKDQFNLLFNFMCLLLTYITLHKIIYLLIELSAQTHYALLLLSVSTEALIIYHINL